MKWCSTNTNSPLTAKQQLFTHSSRKFTVLLTDFTAETGMMHQHVLCTDAAHTSSTFTQLCHVNEMNTQLIILSNSHRPDLPQLADAALRSWHKCLHAATVLQSFLSWPETLECPSWSTYTASAIKNKTSFKLKFTNINEEKQI